VEVKFLKIAIPNNGSMVNQHFGMSKSFVIATIEDKKIVNIEEISAAEHSHQHQGLADLLLKHGATVVISGGIGEGAISGLKQNGLKIIKGASGEYKKVIEEYINGTLKDKNVTCNHHGEHHHQ
jgi:predicted Fe-Mo cluster-binding NifX family protein